MNVQPIPHEQGRFFVDSASRPMQHTVDLNYKEEPWIKSRAACGCEDSHIRGHICKHIIRVVAFERERLGL